MAMKGYKDCCCFFLVSDRRLCVSCSEWAGGYIDELAVLLGALPVHFVIGYGVISISEGEEECFLGGVGDSELGCDVMPVCFV